MERIQKLPEITRELTNQVQDLRSQVDQLSKAIGVISKNYAESYTKNYGNTDIPVKNSCGPSNIIPFPLSARFGPGKAVTPLSGCIHAMPGKPLSADIVDYRPLLQRDGLVLLSWDKRITEIGEQYTAYWVTSAGIPRFYASKPRSPEDFFLARPHHKSYAAEDGIEFYGQKAPAYVVHVAPELMMHNPAHGELRQIHIQTLKEQGSNLDFDYKYLLKTEKKRNLPEKKTNKKDSHQAG